MSVAALRVGANRRRPAQAARPRAARHAGRRRRVDRRRHAAPHAGRSPPRGTATPRRAALRRAARTAHPRGHRPRTARAVARRSHRHRGHDQRPRPRLRGTRRPARTGHARPRRGGDRPPRRARRRAAGVAPRSLVTDGRRPPRRRLAPARGDPAPGGRRSVRHHPSLRCARRLARGVRGRRHRGAVRALGRRRGVEPPRGGSDERGQDHVAQRTVAVDPARPTAS